MTRKVYLWLSGTKKSNFSLLTRWTKIWWHPSLASSLMINILFDPETMVLISSSLYVIGTLKSLVIPLSFLYETYMIQMKSSIFWIFSQRGFRLRQCCYPRVLHIFLSIHFWVRLVISPLLYNIFVICITYFCIRLIFCYLFNGKLVSQKPAFCTFLIKNNPNLYSLLQSNFPLLPVSL